MGRRLPLAAGIGALLGLAWWGLFELIAAGVVCTYDNFGCLGTAVIAVPVFTVVAFLLSWYALRSLEFRKPWLQALLATAIAVLAMVVLATGYPFLAPVVFAASFALVALFG
ncbi:hypothetical protein [Lentzea sp. NBRC 105346]|uniref:hypothetical protein n=1 Tax=Lentzea sp. NBRC 105346 TaxID=3032205 RepID=UPI002556F871|nr:hypothetical protein [Lentzea sp. NBRC 105346]